MTLDQLEKLHAFIGKEVLSTDELNVIIEHEEEFLRRGNFARVFPLSANVDYYS